VWAIPTIAVSIWDICVVVAKPTVNTDWKFVPVKKYNKMVKLIIISARVVLCLFYCILMISV
jgi:hypothetical protein